LKMCEKLHYCWPKTPNFFNLKVSQDATESFHDFTVTSFVTEKLDGFNVCVSSRGYIGSRNNIVAKKGDDLLSKRITKTSLEKLEPLFEKVQELNKEVAKRTGINVRKLETLIYGEMLSSGTASSKYDIYNYKERGFEAGELYVFGIGTVFHKDDLDDSESYNYLQKMMNVFRYVRFESGKKQFITVPMHDKLNSLLAGFGVKTVPFMFEGYFGKFLKDKSSQFNDVIERKIEGLVIVTKTNTLKLKHPNFNTNYENTAVNTWRVKSNCFCGAVERLKKLVDSADLYCPLLELERKIFDEKFKHFYEKKKFILLTDLSASGKEPSEFDTLPFRKILAAEIIESLKKSFDYPEVDPSLVKDIEHKLDKKMIKTMQKMGRNWKKGVDVAGIRELSDSHDCIIV